MQDSRDDDGAFGAGFDDRGEVFFFDATDTVDGEVVGEGFVRGADVFETDGGSAGFRGGHEKRAESDVVDWLGGSFFGLIQNVRGFADDEIFTDPGADIRDGCVVLTDVDAFRSRLQCDVDVVVDDQRDAGGLCDGMEFAGHAQDIGRFVAFGAQLQDADAAVDHRLRGGTNILRQDVAEIDDSVEKAVSNDHK